MSHIRDITLQIKRINAIKFACNKLGYELCEGQETYRWYGRFMNDWPLPENVKVEDIGKCHHAIKVPGATYEIGVIKTEKGFKLQYDFWSSGELDKVCGKNLSKLTNEIGMMEVEKAAMFKNYTTTRSKEIVDEKTGKKKIRIAVKVK